MAGTWETDSTIAYMVELGWFLTSAIDGGHGDVMSYEEAKRRIADGTIFTILRERMGTAPRGPWRPGPVEDIVLAALQDRSAKASKGNDEEWYGVKNKGLCLLLAYTYSVISYLAYK